ncbi:MAG: hypothetical protein OQK73_07895 [Gammaproteobacteria bacterium]|nr:hypothetical protein [Gammaproteobacteria bacterium]
MKIFWIILIASILFVVGSASALRYFGNPPEKKNQDSLADDDK